MSIPFWADGWEPESFYDKIALNIERGMHTLCLLDIKVKEQSLENLMRGRKVYEPPRYMSTRQAAEQLLAIASRRSSEGKETPLNSETACVAVVRIGSDSQRLLTTTLAGLGTTDMGPPLHSIVIPGKMHPMEEEAITIHKA